MELAGLIQKLGDERLAPYLISQLRHVADEAPEYAGLLVYLIAEAINDEDLKQLANNYDAAIYDESESDDESDAQDSTPNRCADGVTVAAIERSVMLKDFLKLAEYKIKR